MSIKFIGEIPIEDYISYLGERRFFNKERAILYTNEIYNVDISKYIDNYSYCFFYPYDIYSRYENKNERKKPLEQGRDYFQSYGKRYFGKFWNTYNDKEYTNDMLYPIKKASSIHHIHPIVYGGGNELTNLIPVCDLTHDILHLNQKENDYKKCHQAVDYLGYLYIGALSEICDKYKLYNYKDNVVLMHKIFKSCLEIEMTEFYQRIAA